ncbi:hypothetical protein CC78DRAFT_529185 [Lojkania enalia]|uniref:Uncharacterized protein n=1 Tax=Lojkania enalia TaxID=147567 RepID=A0A9P4NA14_9PLEO|nr:hypothetical protein CC78DRAFT_529185 [Didymosphaeria enalia]
MYRQNLSVVLSLRPYRNDDFLIRSNFKFYPHLLFILLGIHPSITPVLRNLMIPSIPQKDRLTRATSIFLSATLIGITSSFPAVHTAVIYSIICDRKRTCVIEKDNLTTKTLLSSPFITIANRNIL